MAECAARFPSYLVVSLRVIVFKNLLYSIAVSTYPEVSALPLSRLTLLRQSQHMLFELLGLPELAETIASAMTTAWNSEDVQHCSSCSSERMQSSAFVLWRSSSPVYVNGPRPPQVQHVYHRNQYKPPVSHSSPPGQHASIAFPFFSSALACQLISFHTNKPSRFPSLCPKDCPVESFAAMPPHGAGLKSARQ